MSNLCRSSLLVPVIFASILLPFAKLINYREYQKLDTFDSYHDCGKIWMVVMVLVFDLMFICQLRILHLILSRNNFVKSWKTFRFNAVRAPFATKLEILFTGSIIGMLYFRKNQKISSLNLHNKMTERDHISKVAVNSID